MGYPLSQLQPQNYAPDFPIVHGLLSETPMDTQALSPYPDIPSIMNSSLTLTPNGNQEANAQTPRQSVAQQTFMPTALTNAKQVDMPNMVATPSQAATMQKTMPAAASDPAKLTPGQLLTYNAEGSYNKTNHPHWPGGTSGVTIGKGYDMGLRTVVQTKADLMRAGVDEARATQLANGAGLKGNDAAAYVIGHSRDATLSPDEEDKLFHISYARKEREAKGVYGRVTKGVPGAVNWDGLNPSMRAMATDFIYQGTGPAQMRAVSQNNASSLIQYIQSNPDLMKFEKGRGRINFLQRNP
jgi:hypothetical protein